MEVMEGAPGLRSVRYWAPAFAGEVVAHCNG
jgi:hypothetical protein